MSNKNTTLSINSIVDFQTKVNSADEEMLNYFSENILQAYEEQETHQDFIQMIRDDKQPVSKKVVLKFKNKLLNTLVPNIHKNYLRSIIKNQFRGDEEAYIKTVPLFFSMFSHIDKLICDDAITSQCKKERRNLKKKQKRLILYSAQLLKLMGLKRSAIITNDCVNYYKEEMQKTDDFLAQYRLVSADGAISKLVSNEAKQKQKVAQILKISECMALMAKDKGFSFMLLTLTLPPAFHCNAYSGKDSFAGYTPEEALATINRYWKGIRAKLHNAGYKVGDDFFGIQVLELQGGSTLHLHCLMYCSENDIDDIEVAISEVKALENQRYTDKATDSEEKRAFNKAHRVEMWDVSKKDDTREEKWGVVRRDESKVTDATNAGARYVFKYIMKTHTNYKDTHEDDSALKNIAARFFYNCRGFNFFGMKGSITKFNFLQKNFSKYTDVLDRDLCRVLSCGDYYDFLHNYEKYFSNAYTKEKRFVGVAFDKSRYEEENNRVAKSILNNETVLISKKQYCVFERIYEQELTNVKQADFTKLEYANLKHAYDSVQLKQAAHEQDFKQYIEESRVVLATAEKLSRAEAMKLYKFGSTDFIHDYEYLDLDFDFDLNFASHVEVVQLLNAIQEKRSPMDKTASQIEQHDYCDS